MKETNLLSTVAFWPYVLFDQWFFNHNEYALELFRSIPNIRLFEELPFYPFWARLGLLDAGDYIGKQQFYDPREFNFYAYLVRVNVDPFPPLFPPSPEEFLLTWYFSDNVDEIKRATRRYMSGETWAGEGYTPGHYYLRTDAMRHLPDIPQLRAFNADWKLSPMYRNLRHIFQIIFSDFGGSDIFRYIYNYSVQQSVGSSTLSR